MSIYERVTSNGVVLVDTAAIVAEVTAEFKSFLGLGSSDTIDPSTTEGRELSAEVTARTNAARALAYMQNQMNPDLADGVHFDATYANMGGERDAAEQSTCDCLLAGVAGTIIPAGAIAQDDNGELWILVSETTIPAGGSITSSFRAENFGPIAAAIGEINQIVSGVVGWETITNESIASLGKNEQTLFSAKQQRKRELGANSRGVSYSVISAVSQLDGVNGVQFRENRKNITQVIDNLTIPANNMWLCVDGGAGSEIAEQYVINTWSADFYGEHNTITESYTDEISGQVLSVEIDRPTDVPVKINISARVASSDNATDAVKEAIIEYANGNIDGANGFSLGNDVSPFEIAWAVNNYLLASNVYVTLVQVTTVAADTPSTNTLDLELWQKASITESNISVTLL
jgi:hypothetical protein